MKKVIIILICLMLCGCDYKELNNLGIVTMITIDYDKEYKVNVEVLNNDKKSNSKSCILKGKGKSLDEAITNAENKSDYVFNYSHIYVIILSKKVINNNVIHDYLTRNKDLRKDFYILYSNDIDSITKYKTNESIGESLYKTIDNNALFITSIYRDIIHARLNKQSYFIGNVELNNNEFLFKEVISINNKTTKLNQKDTLLYALLNKKIESFIISSKNTYKIYSYKIKTKLNNNTLTIFLKPNVRITSLKEGDISTYEGLKNEEILVNKITKEKIDNILNYSYKKNIDFNNLENIYYLKYGKKLKLKDIKVKVIVKSSINEKGLSMKGFKYEK